MKLKLQRIGVWSFIRVAFVINLIVGFLIGIVYALVVLMITSMQTDLLPEGALELNGFRAVAPLLTVLLPFLSAFFFAVTYTLFGALAIAIYNLVARATGGFEIEFEPGEQSEVTSTVLPDQSTIPGHSEAVHQWPIAAKTTPPSPFAALPPLTGDLEGQPASMNVQPGLALPPTPPVMSEEPWQRAEESDQNDTDRLERT